MVLAALPSIANTSAAQGSESVVNNDVVIEILSWKAKSSDIDDDEMIAAVDGMLNDLRALQGFKNQSLYKNSNGVWIDVYYWDTPEDAHASNEAMENKKSLIELLDLIKPGSVTIEVMKPVQSSGAIQFKQ